MPSSKQKNLTGPYACIQALYWMYFAAIMSFSGFFLLDGGFSNTQIGIIAAAAGIISALLQPVLASYADRPDSPSLKKLIQIFYMIQLLLGVGLFFSRSLILTGLLYGISIALLQLLTPFINALGMESINQGQQLNFGLARGMGSVAYAIICYVLGIITVKAGAGSIPASVIILTFFTLGCLILFPFVKTQGTSGAKASGNSLANPLLFFRKYKHFSLVLIGCIFIYLSHVLLNNFNFQIAQGKGGGSSEMGTASAIAAMCELPTLFLFGYIIKKIRCDSDPYCRYFLRAEISWNASGTWDLRLLWSTDSSDAWMGTYDCRLCLLCKCSHGTRRCHQGTGIFYHDLYSWLCDRFLPWRGTD